jgi:hypothetical protein
MLLCSIIYITLEMSFSERLLNIIGFNSLIDRSFIILFDCVNINSEYMSKIIDKNFQVIVIKVIIIILIILGLLFKKQL